MCAREQWLNDCSTCHTLNTCLYLWTHNHKLLSMIKEYFMAKTTTTNKHVSVRLMALWPPILMWREKGTTLLFKKQSQLLLCQRWPVDYQGDITDRSLYGIRSEMSHFWDEVIKYLLSFLHSLLFLLRLWRAKIKMAVTEDRRSLCTWISIWKGASQLDTFILRNYLSKK